jgi:hypothetical protein
MRLQQVAAGGAVAIAGMAASHLSKPARNALCTPHKRPLQPGQPAMTDLDHGKMPDSQSTLVNPAEAASPTVPLTLPKTPG